MGRWNTSRSFKLVQSPFAFTPLEQSLCVSLVAHKLSLCFCAQFCGFCGCSDESAGKPCNDREKHSLGERENTLKLWGTQAASGHNASSSAAEELATETAGDGYNSPAIKITDTGPLSHTNQWFNNCVNETDYSIGSGAQEFPLLLYTGFWNGLPFPTRLAHFPLLLLF